MFRHQLTNEFSHLPLVNLWNFSSLSNCRTVTQTIWKAAKNIACPNAGQADVEVEVPIRELPTNSSIKEQLRRIRRKPLNWGFHPNIGLADAEPADIFWPLSDSLESLCAVARWIFILRKVHENIFNNTIKKWRDEAWWGVAQRSVAWCSMLRRGIACRSLTSCGVAWRGVAWRGVACQARLSLGECVSMLVLYVTS